MTTPTHPTTAREALAAVGITNPEQLTRTNGVGWDFDQPATITPAFDTGDDTTTPGRVGVNCSGHAIFAIRWADSTRFRGRAAGVNYWADIESYQWNDDKPAEFKAVLLDIEEGWGGTPVKYHVDLAVMMKGLTRYAKTYGVARLASLLDPDFGDYDAIDADMIVQFGIFGKVVYG